VTCHYGHVNRFCYLLTYLLTYNNVCWWVTCSGRPVSAAGAENSVESVSDVMAGLRHHRR